MILQRSQLQFGMQPCRNHKIVLKKCEIKNCLLESQSNKKSISHGTQSNLYYNQD